MTYGSGSGTNRLFVVEARNSVSIVKPVLRVGGNEITTEWRRVQFARGPIGVPTFRNSLNPWAAENGLFEFETAMALAMWLLAMPEDDSAFKMFPSIGLRVRLVKVEMSYSYDTKELGVGPEIDRKERDEKWIERPVEAQP